MKGIEDCIKEVIQKMEGDGSDVQEALLYYADKYLIKTTVMTRKGFAEKYPEHAEEVEKYLSKVEDEDEER